MNYGNEIKKDKVRKATDLIFMSFGFEAVQNPRIQLESEYSLQKRTYKGIIYIKYED